MAAQLAKSAICFSMPSSVSSLGVKRPMRDFTGEGATLAAVSASAPACRICRQIFTCGSTACTASVTTRWRAASSGVDSLAPRPPSSLGEKPPVMIMPTPPRARSAKKAAMRSKPPSASSRPVCIEPIRARFFRWVKPRSSGANRWG